MNLFANSTPEFIDLSRKFTELEIENAKLKAELKEERVKHKYAFLAAEAEARDVDALRELLRQAHEELAHIKEVEFPRRVELVAKGWREKVSRLESELEELKKLNREGNTKVSGGVEPAFEFKYTRNLLEREMSKYYGD